MHQKQTLTERVAQHWRHARIAVHTGGAREMVRTGGAVVPWPQVAESRPMSFEEYWELPAELRAEYSDGTATVNPPPSYQHQAICLQLMLILVPIVGSRGAVVPAAGWILPGTVRRTRIPDIMVLREPPAGDWVTDPPVLAVEVVSQNRRNDVVRKATEYLEAGLERYWIVDPRDGELEAFARSSSGWQTVAHLTEKHPTGVVELGGLGTVPLDLTTLLAPATASAAPGNEAL
ncbi:MAG: Uma2 family endonuclease [Angustibacter sp.]